MLAVGYETALRAGVALMNSAAEYHASGAFSGLGVVCGAARLLNLDEATFLHALGIAEYFGPRCPMMRLIDHPSMLRDAHGAGAMPASTPYSWPRPESPAHRRKPRSCPPPSRTGRIWDSAGRSTPSTSSPGRCAAGRNPRSPPPPR